MGLLGGHYLGGHDVENSSCRRGCTLRHRLSACLRADPCRCSNPKRGRLGHFDGHADDVVKAAFQLTPAQEKYWPAVEDAIRARAMNRQARIAGAPRRLDKLREGNAVEVLRNRDPIDFLQRRADALAQRSADLKKLAGAWEPLYKTLSPDQKRRMAFLTIYVLRGVRNVAEQRSEGDEAD